MTSAVDVDTLDWIQTRLVNVDDDVIEAMFLPLARLHDDLNDRGEAEAADVCEVLAWMIRSVLTTRRRAEENLRVEVDGNGHGVWVDDDVPGWWAYCYCVEEAGRQCLGTGPYPTRVEAVEAAERHVAEAGGVWMPWSG